MSERMGQQFGEYRLICRLGQGHFAEVYEAEHVHLGWRVAVKLLKGVFAEQDIEEFRIEARIVADLEHDHIVKVRTFNVEREIPYLVMDYAPNGSLSQFRGKQLPLQTVVTYVKQIAAALQYAHDHRVIHRDIKPANMLLGKRKEILVSDFGIAILAHSTTSWEEQNRAGTLAYMAPEQFDRKAEFASDQYSLGITVYEWLGGELPFTEGDIAYKHREVQPPPLHEKTPISPAVEKVILTALAKNPKERFATVQDFADKLEKAYQEEIRELLDKPNLTAEILSQDHIQQALIELIVANPDWWNGCGRANIRSLRQQAEREARTDIADVLSTLAQRTINLIATRIEQSDWESVANLFQLLKEAAPPSANSQVWTSLLETLSATPQVLHAVLGNWELYSWLLKLWGRMGSLLANKNILAWFPATWPDFWAFLALPLPVEWQDLAVRNLLLHTSAVPAIKSIGQKQDALIRSYLHHPRHSRAQLRIALEFFAKLAEDGYTHKLNALGALLRSADAQDKWDYWDFVETVLLSAHLSKKEIVELLEGMYSSSYKLYYQLPSMLGYVEQYLLAFNLDDLDRPSARQLLLFMNSSPSLPLSQEVRALAQNWHTASAFIEQPVINQKELLALTDAIKQLPIAIRSELLNKLSVSFTSRIESESDLICLIYGLNTVLTEPELFRFLQHLAEVVKEEYERKRSEGILVAYIQIALQAETITREASRTDQEQFVTEFLGILLQHADRTTYQKLDAIAQHWSPKLSNRWHGYESKINLKIDKDPEPHPPTPPFPRRKKVLTSTRKPTKPLGIHFTWFRLNPDTPYYVIGFPLVIVLIFGMAHFATNINPYPPYYGVVALYDPLQHNDLGNEWSATFAFSGDFVMLGSSPSNDFGGTCGFTDSAYHISQEKPNRTFICNTNSSTYSDFTVEVQTRIIKGDCGGIAFRNDGSNAKIYTFEICTDGTYFLAKYLGNTAPVTLTSGQNAAIKTTLGQTNLIAVVADGNRFNLYVNNRHIGNSTDNAYSLGYIGFIANDAGKSTEVAYSNAKVWSL